MNSPKSSDEKFSKDAIKKVKANYDNFNNFMRTYDFAQQFS